MNKENIPIGAFRQAITDRDLNAINNFIDMGYKFVDSSLLNHAIYITKFNENNIKTVKLMLERGVKVNDVDPYGVSPLFKAMNTPPNESFLKAREWNYALLDLLIDFGANINEVNNEGETPLSFACACKSADQIRYLIKNGADVNPTVFSGNPDDISERDRKSCSFDIVRNILNRRLWGEIDLDSNLMIDILDAGYRKQETILEKIDSISPGSELYFVVKSYLNARYSCESIGEVTSVRKNKIIL